jgi:hypothetical protein
VLSRSSWHQAVFECWAAHEAFRHLGFATDDIYIIVGRIAGIGTERFDPPRWALSTELRTQGKVVVFVARPLFEDEDEAKTVMSQMQDFAARVNAGEFAEAELHPLYTESQILKDRVALVSVIASKGIVFPSLAN